MTIRFDDRVAVVTGAGQGLGRSHALFLARRGAKVVVNDVGGAVDGAGNDTAPAEAVVEDIRAGGGEAVASFESVAERGTATAIVRRAVDVFGKVDILVNNAGILRDASFHEMSFDDFEEVLRVHLLGSFYVTRAAFPVMRDHGYGRIVMTSSAAGLYGNPGQANYAAAKLAVVGLMNALKVEGRKSNVLVNTISPVADTRMGAGVFPDYFKELVRPELVSAAVAYLCSEECTASGDVITAAAGYFAKAQMVEAAGVAFPPGSEVTPEMIADRYGEISDLSEARPQRSAMHAFKKIFMKVRRASAAPAAR
ncbi:MAG: SDR family NAD(P)-dependent oxidoreductase [Thermoanaerobaculia bacterium]